MTAARVIKNALLMSPNSRDIVLFLSSDFRLRRARPKQGRHGITPSVETLVS